MKRMSMAAKNMVFVFLLLLTSVFACSSNPKKWQKKHIAEEKIRIIGQALEQAEERLIRYEERHDRILNQICSYYFVHQELEAVLASARIALNEALEFAANLRKLQKKIISSYTGEEDVSLLNGSGTGNNSRPRTD